MSASSELRHILVTGANKGIGKASVLAILKYPNTRVFLGTRDETNGDQAKEQIVKEHPEYKDRVSVLQIDVASDSSVNEAAARVRLAIGLMDKPNLFAVVNNAGVATGKLSDVLNVNVRGIKRVSDAFVPMLEQEGGRLVNVTSAAGPMYVATVESEHWKRVLTKPKSWEEVEDFLTACEGIKNGEAGFRDAGLGSGNVYGISKSAANALTIVQARQWPSLKVNALTPGFIATDLTREMFGGGDPAEKGAKPPSDSTRALERLLFDVPTPPVGSGHYYGSDAQRSPLDRYRSPGDPPYTSEDEPLARE